MLTRMVEERVGEWFTDGTADDWLAHHAAVSGGPNQPRALTPEQEAMVRRLAGPPPVGDFWLVRTGDYWHRLEVIGLYDGWVWWRKRLALGTDGPLPVLHHHDADELEEIAPGRLRTDGRSTFPGYPWEVAH